MSSTPKEYKKLPGNGTRRIGTWFFTFSRSFCSLWMGADHLLLADRTGFTETYKRFYFRDIQAIIIRKTNSGAIGNFLLAIPVMIFGAAALSVANLPGRITLWIMAGMFAFFVLLNLISGPTCVTHIKTAVQTEQLPAWGRIRTARKGMKRIRPFILQAQPEIPIDEIKARLADNLSRQFQGPATDAT
jgi:hypothetical protein